MTARSLSLLSPAAFPRGLLHALMALFVGVVLAACGGSADAPPPPGSTPVIPVVPVPPTITQQPVDVTVTVGQTASFTVAATGDATITYQWQKNGTAIAGATSTTYTTPATVLGDSGATFRAVATNGAGSATSNNATLTVTASAPVLTITPQPASTSVVAGASASFTVGGTCSAGTLVIQWQRNNGTAGAFADIAGATSATYSFTTAIGDNAAQFRAALSCSGQAAANSSVATLTVTSSSSVLLSLYSVQGRDQARITGANVIDKQPDGSYVIAVNSQLKRLSADLSSITAITGNNGDGYTDGPAATAQFRLPFGITHDSAGVLYVADRQNYVIRKVAVDGTVSTLAGTAQMNGNVDGSGAAARFQEPIGIAMGPDGDLYVADAGNNTIRRVTTAGVVTTYAGNGTNGLVNGPAASAQFSRPTGIGIAANGDLIVTDSGNSRVRRIVRAGTAAGAVETLAGTTLTTLPGADGPGTSAVIFNPTGITVVGSAAFVRDNAGLVRRIDLATADVTTFAGSRTRGSGIADGVLGEAQFDGSSLGITPGVAGGLMLAETRGIRNVDALGAVTTIAASNPHETDAGIGVLAQLPLDAGSIAVDSAGLIANFDALSRAVRRIDSAGAVTLTAGLTGATTGLYDGKGSAAQFLARDGSPIAAGASSVLWVGDNFAVRRIAADGTVATVAGSLTDFGSVDGAGSLARFNSIGGLAVRSNGDLLVADFGSYAIRKVDSAGVVSTIAGALGTTGFADGPVATARLQGPRRITIAPDGSVWFIDGPRLDTAGIRRLSADGTTVASNFPNLPGINLAALAFGADGTLYVMQNADLALPGGLYAYNVATGTATRLLSANVGQTLVLGANGSLPVIRSIAVLGPKRILLTASTGQLLLATLP